MKYLIKDFLTFREGRTVNMTVWDGFDGKVKIIKNRFYKWLVEIVDVTMCYSCQEQLRPGEKIWVRKKDLFRDEDGMLIAFCDGKFSGYKLKHKRRVSNYEDDLPF